MGFWGKAVGAGVGFMVGGPLGAILGGVIGHTYDVGKEQMRGFYQRDDYSWPEVEHEFDRQYLFYVSLASLAAKMAKADGVITSEEIRAFDHFLRIDLRLSVEERKTVARIFNEAKNSPEDAIAIARQFRGLIGYHYDVLEMMVQLLFRIALADDHLHKNEEIFIQNVASAFGMSSNVYEQIKALYIKQNDNAYRILGLGRNASDDEVKKTYRKLVQEYHPDRMQAKGVPEDFMKIANEKMSEINQAYDQICKERGI